MTKVCKRLETLEAGLDTAISYLRPFSRGAREPRKPEMPPNHTAKWQRKWPTGGGQLRAGRAEQRELKKDPVPSPERSS
jgi:hypothetical protein